MLSSLASRSGRSLYSTSFNTAALDRYSAIRRFFINQNVAHTPITTRNASTSARLALWASRNTTMVAAAPAPLRIRTFTRAFATTHQHPPKPPPETQKTSKPPEASANQPENSLENDPGVSTDPLPHARDVENYSRFFQRLALSLPHPHRPTREDFLNVATSFWQRLRIRFKWFTVRGFRKFNADDISAFITWFVMSQTLWILVGTTTFFSVVFSLANSLSLQRYVARAISDYLTSETGINIIFESAIVPKWKDSRLSFKNVYVSRRPLSQMESVRARNEGHLAAVGYDVSGHPAYHRIGEDDDEVQETFENEDMNYTMFDVNIDSVDVTLSLKRWLDGKGLVEDAVVRGVRGVIDRRNVFWDPENPLDPALFRHPAKAGDFELENLQLEDVLVTVYQPGDFRPYTASIFRADIRLFRKRWLFYDFLRAENVVGQFDNCLFSLHKPQSIGRTNEKDLQDGDRVRMTRIRIDGVNIDHLQNSTTMEGPISWITSGKLDAVLDIKFPHDPDEELPFNQILGEIADAISVSLTSDIARIPGQRELAKPALTVPEVQHNEENKGEDFRPKVVVDIDIRLRDLKAAVPIFPPDLSYVNYALVRPIVAFMNANRTLIPIHCKIVKDLSEFDGAMTMWETGLMDEIAVKTYDAMAYHVSQSAMNRQRIKAVSLWSLQQTANALMTALRGMTDPLKEVYTNESLQPGLYAALPLTPEV